VLCIVMELAGKTYGNSDGGDVLKLISDHKKTKQPIP
jgi:hypothetical protein